MKLIDSSVDLIEIENPFMKIEKVGRTCYKSSSEMTEETAKKFYKSLVSRNHTAMLEHAVFCFEVTESLYSDLRSAKYFNRSIEELENGRERYLVSANLRAINETDCDELLTVLYDIDPMLVYTNCGVQLVQLKLLGGRASLVDIDDIPDIQEHAYKAHKHFTFHFICDRGVTHEIVRHRPASYAQESTRYCNYSKDKFGGEITCIKPAFYDEWDGESQFYFEQSLNKAEDCYLRMLERGRSPQEARAVLPNALKTEIVMTANCVEFDHFFNLRSNGTTGTPHPDMKVVADEAYSIYLQNTKF